MKNIKRYSSLVFFLLILSGMSDAGVIVEKQSRDMRVCQILEPTDTSENKTFYQKLQWDVGLGITKNGPMGFSASTALFYPLKNHLSIKASFGLLTFRGPEFAYRSERYFNDYTYYGYEIEDYTIGNYLAYQWSVGLNYAVPFHTKLNVFAAPYHLRLMRSRYITKSEMSRGSGTYGGGFGVDGRDEKVVSAISSYNYGFSGINMNDFGMQVGVGYQHQRLGFSIAGNFGFVDWGKNSVFGENKETNSFGSFSVNYRIKK